VMFVSDFSYLFSAGT